MRKFVQHAKKLAATDHPIHIYGEIGTGKKRICQAIHNGSARRNGPFLSINCATSDPSNLERAMFGSQDANGVRPGLVAEARGGTLCIEEIGALDSQLQARLLRTLTEIDSTNLEGGHQALLDSRIITTSSTRLELDASRPIDSDLLLLLSRYTCRVPTLNERMEDFETLVHNYLERHLDRATDDFDPAALTALKRHRWKGNVQELYNVLQYMACTSDGRLTCEELPYYIISHREQGPMSDHSPLSPQPQAEKGMSQLCRDIERHGFLAESLEILTAFAKGKSRNTAYGRTSLQRLLRERGLQLTQQQLRLRLEKLNAKGLLLIRPGRAGTTISARGEAFLEAAWSWQHFPPTEESS
jgi:DNA-binding NtrC family response regulator